MFNGSLWLRSLNSFTFVSPLNFLLLVFVFFHSNLCFPISFFWFKTRLRMMDAQPCNLANMSNYSFLHLIDSGSYYFEVVLKTQGYRTFVIKMSIGQSSMKHRPFEKATAPALSAHPYWVRHRFFEFFWNVVGAFL